MDLDTPLKSLPGIGSYLSFKLSNLNLLTVKDLIYHFPFRYDDFSNVTTSLDAQVGETVTLQGEIWSIKNIYTRTKKVLTQAIFNDGTSPINLTWFNQGYITKQIQTGDRLQISGKLTKYKNKLSIMVPKWEKYIPTFQVGSQSLHTGRLVAVYPETEGLTSKWIRTKIDQVLPTVLDKIEDPLPGNIRGGMLYLTDAISQIHFPKNYQEVEQATQRLGFDELFYVTLATQRARKNWQEKNKVKPLKVDQKKVDEFIKKLPFKLTNAQQKVLNEALVDLKKDRSMNRLIQGEVGSGKTVVAAILAYVVHLNGMGVLFMAPTEILAFQHFETMVRLLTDFGIKIGLYTGSRKFSKGVYPDVIVGTHALLSQKLAIENVGLIIVDEQQRFGVEQRTLLRSKAKLPHFLTMTATPIPRTVALTLYGDLDLSIIDEMPKGRSVIKTYLVPEKKRADGYKFITKKIKDGDQTYIITPLIEPSETNATAKAAKVEYERLQKVFPKLKLGLLHGRMKSKDKEQVLQDFNSGKIQILVSTSVVEVGMDIPNATIMVIEGAERFGLAQLHQLRGRVGRGTKESFCLLYTTGYVAEERQRLKYLETTFDGLKLAELDLKIRGSGAIFGTTQHGRFDFKFASFSDIELVEKVRKSVSKTLAEDPNLDKYPLLQAKISELSPDVMPD